MDIVDKRKRSEIMSKIRSKNTRPELIVRKGLFALGHRYSLYSKKLPGKPDLVLRKYNAVIFVHGCFWHGHSCNFYSFPKSRVNFWRAKIDRNKERDINVVKELVSLGWRVGIIWECAVNRKKKDILNKLFHDLSLWLKSDGAMIEVIGDDHNYICFFELSI